MKLFTTIFILLLGFGNAYPQTEISSDSKDDNDDFVNYLEKFSEQSLPLDIESYRLMIWPTFYSPILVRIDRKDGVITLAAKKLKGQGGYDAKGIERQTNTRVSEKSFDKIRRLFVDSDFANMTSTDARYEPNANLNYMVCLDGSQWYLEQVIDGKHHLVNRYCPDEKKFIDIGLEIVKLSGLRVSKKDLF